MGHGLSRGNIETIPSYGARIWVRRTLPRPWSLHRASARRGITRSPRRRLTCSLHRSIRSLISYHLKPAACSPRYRQAPEEPCSSPSPLYAFSTHACKRGVEPCPRATCGHGISPWQFCPHRRALPAGCHWGVIGPRGCGALGRRGQPKCQRSPTTERQPPLCRKNRSWS